MWTDRGIRWHLPGTGSQGCGKRTGTGGDDKLPEMCHAGWAALVRLSGGEMSERSLDSELAPGPGCQRRAPLWSREWRFKAGFFFLSQRTNTFGGSLIKGYMYQRTKKCLWNTGKEFYTVHSLLMLSIKMGYLRRCVTFWSGLP